MKVLAILSQKGGVGKTTLATCLAVASEAAGRSAVILDLDPQGSATFWKDVRGDTAPAVHKVDAFHVPEMIRACEAARVGLVILDGAAVARDLTLAAARAADFVLVPARPAVLDTMGITHTLEVVRRQAKPHAVVLTFCAPRRRETAETIDFLEGLGTPLCPVTIGQRAAFSRAQSMGQAAQEFEPKGAAAQEIAALYDYMFKEITRRKPATPKGKAA